MCRTIAIARQSRPRAPAAWRRSMPKSFWKSTNSSFAAPRLPYLFLHAPVDPAQAFRKQRLCQLGHFQWHHAPHGPPVRCRRDAGEAIAAARGCNNAGMHASLDYLGENVATITDAQHSRDAYLEIFERIAQERLHANVSGKLTQLGLDINIEFCEGLVLSIVARATCFDNFLRIDMEGSPYTQRTIDLVKHVRTRSPAIGTVIQTYLYRTEAHIADRLAYACRIRLCKGAYKEAEEVAFPRKP